MTKREMFVAIRNAVLDNEEMVAFIDHEIDLLERKSTSPKKPTETQKENTAGGSAGCGGNVPHRYNRPYSQQYRSV